MKMLTCKAMGADCDFFAKGKTADEVMAKMMDHVKKMHPEKMAGSGDEDMAKMKEMAMAKMTDDGM